MYEPKISIVIPAYNASNYLAEAIDSALSQTYKNVEIIVVNDGSPDDGATAKVAAKYGDKIRYFEKPNGGSSSALNVGIANMTGEWFSWLSHDDLYEPKKLEKQIEYINSLNLASSSLAKHIFFSASELIDANGRTIRSADLNHEKLKSQKINSFAHNGYLIAEPTVYSFHGCSCLVHRDALKDVGSFDESLRLLNDLDLWFRFYSNDYKVHYLPEPLVKGRVHAKQVSKSIGYSYHNPEQDMFWNRSLDWLITNYPGENELFLRYGRNAYLKTRYEEGDRAFRHVKNMKLRKYVLKIIYVSIACVRNIAKKMYLKIKT